MTYQERIADCDTRVHPSAWEFLVKHWSSETGQGAITEIAPIYPDIAQKEESRDDLLVKVLGEDRRGHVRCFGLVPTPSDVFGSNPTRAECLRILSETKNAGKEEKHRMQQEIANLKQKYEDVQRDMSMIRAMFESTEKMPQDLHKPEKRIGIPNANNYISPNGSPKNDVSSSQSSHAVPPPQALRAKDIVKNFLIPSDAQGGNEVYLKSLKKPHGNVARGYILSEDPMTKVGGVELGPQYWEVQIDVAIFRNEPLLRPYGNYLTIGDAVGVTVAWPYTYVKRK
uniref:Transposase Tnp1/En/Spm-like domain-containing protein n=1 Tax=Ananas comosus var. bracteatus TaxID=296719 RepID=A0A6V7QU63_ANACO